MSSWYDRKTCKRRLTARDCLDVLELFDAEEVIIERIDPYSIKDGSLLLAWEDAKNALIALRRTMERVAKEEKNDRYR